VSVLLRDRDTGEFMGVPPTGRSFSVQHMHMYRVADGKVAEHWACRDDLGQFAQLGLTPPPAGA
jgi:predicted ester cyclase